MPDDDREQDGHIMGGMQCWSWRMASLQKPNMLQMRHCGSCGKGDIPTSSTTRGDDSTHRRPEDRDRLDGNWSGAEDRGNKQISDEQQARDNDIAEMWGNQAECGRGKGGHRRRIAFRNTFHGFTKDEDRQEFQNQCGQSSIYISPDRETRLQ
eukprot:12542945-Heterocapsa_arctica.AAC.1